jgi:hypothetical protein
MVDLAEGESVILTGPATNWHSKRTGTLTLTNFRIAFEPKHTLGLEVGRHRMEVGPHRMEVGRHRMEVSESMGFEMALDQLVSARLVPPLLGNVVYLEVLSHRQKGMFEVDNVHEWFRAIRDARGGPQPVSASPVPPTVQFDTDAPPTTSAPPACPRCGGTPVREANGMLRCPNCSPGP